MSKATFKVLASHTVHSMGFCEELAKQLGVSYGGIADNRHFFESMTEERKERIDATTWRIIPRSYRVIECTDEDIENGNIAYFVKHGLTHSSTKEECRFFETPKGIELMEAEWTRFFQAQGKV